MALLGLLDQHHYTIPPVPHDEVDEGRLLARERGGFPAVGHLRSRHTVRGGVEARASLGARGVIDGSLLTSAFGGGPSTFINGVAWPRRAWSSTSFGITGNSGSQSVPTKKLSAPHAPPSSVGITRAMVGSPHRVSGSLAVTMPFTGGLARCLGDPSSTCSTPHDSFFPPQNVKCSAG